MCGLGRDQQGAKVHNGRELRATSKRQFQPIFPYHSYVLYLGTYEYVTGQVQSILIYSLTAATIYAVNNILLFSDCSQS